MAINNLSVVQLYNGMLADSIATLEAYTSSAPVAQSVPFLNLASLYETEGGNSDGKKKALASIVAQRGNDMFNIDSLKLAYKKE